VEMQVLLQEGALLACYHETFGRRPWALIEADGKKLGQYHLLDLLIHNFTGKLLQCNVKGVPTYDAPAFGQLQQPAKAVPLLAICAAQTKNGDLSFFAINRSSDRAQSLRLQIDSFWSGPEVKGAAWVLSAPKMTSPPEEMTMTKQEISLTNAAGDPHRANLVYEFPPRSISALRLYGVESAKGSK